MPTYEYECSGCGHAFERFQGINEDPIRICPECGGKVRRLISAGGGLVFKGPGFYATDYRSGPSEPSGKGKSKTEGKGATDQKPAGKTDKNASD